jgi:hypothetical protein
LFTMSIWMCDNDKKNKVIYTLLYNFLCNKEFFFLFFAYLNSTITSYWQFCQ